MTPLEAVLVPIALALPLVWLMRIELNRLVDPDYLRRHGIVIVAESALESRSDPVGRYMGTIVWRSVTFKGMVYRFDRVIRAERREAIGPGELYLEPGLVYVTGSKPPASRSRPRARARDSADS
jgi:hypothetical protein